MSPGWTGWEGAVKDMVMPRSGTTASVRLVDASSEGRASGRIAEGDFR